MIRRDLIECNTVFPMYIARISFVYIAASKSSERLWSFVAREDANLGSRRDTENIADNPINSLTHPEII